MTRDEIATQVKTELDDLGASFYEVDKDINPSIQDGYNLISALCEADEGYATINFVDELVYYDFSALISNFLHVIGIFNNTTRRWLNPIGMLDLLRMRDDWELITGQPRYFVPVDWKHCLLNPVLTHATGSMIVMYKAKAGTLSSNSTPNLPPEYQDVLLDYTVDDLLDQCEEFHKAMTYFNLWNTSVDNIKRVIDKRSSPQRIFQKRGINY